MHPIALDFGSFQLRWYGVMMALAFIAGFWTASRRAPLTGVSPEKILDSGLWLIAGAIIGARFLYVITYWDNLMANPLYPKMPWTEIFMVQRGGLVYYGGLIGASLATILYTWVKKINLWKFADIMAPSVALGYVFGRIGCFMNGCCFGRACELPWAVTYPPGGPIGRLHPSQLYDSLLNLGLYAGLAWLYRRKKFDGQVFAVYLLCYAFLRSFIELFRGDYSETHIHNGLTPAHLVSIGIVITGVVFYAVLRKKPKTA